jgi:ubiquinone/menaquinone biosynthesis C-methylase UbiE
LNATQARVRDYSEVTETPADEISQDAAAMMRTRYEFIAGYAAGKRVLELCCGSGQGLGYLAHRATQVVGADLSAPLLAQAHRQYGRRIPLVQLDAHTLPFDSGAFDVVAITEALYYFAAPAAVFEECRRILAPGGALTVACVNPDRPAFNPSPFAVEYFNAERLRRTLQGVFDRVSLFGGFPEDTPSTKQRVLSSVKRLAVRWHLIPGSMQGKRLLKRLVFGELVAVPAEITDSFSSPAALTALSATDDAAQFTVIYAVAYK